MNGYRQDLDRGSIHLHPQRDRETIALTIRNKQSYGGGVCMVELDHGQARELMAALLAWQTRHLAENS